MTQLHLKCIFIVMAFASFTDAQSKFINCADPGPPEVYKIYVDKVRASNGQATSAQTDQKLRTIRRFLWDNLRLSAGENASVRDCGTRFPSDATDFDDREFDGLDNMRVVLEVWSVLEDPARGSGTIGLALVPARPLLPPAVYMVPSANLLSSLRQAKQVSAFAPLVLGIRNFQNRKYKESVPLLCAGAQQLAAVLKGQNALGDPAFRTRQEGLQKKIKEITNTAIREAKRTPGTRYDLLEPGNDGEFACPQ
jgi:hypothetical protein